MTSGWNCASLTQDLNVRVDPAVLSRLALLPEGARIAVDLTRVPSLPLARLSTVLV